MARITGKYLSELEWKDINSLKLREARPLLTKARKAFESRQKSIDKSGVYSQALENMKEYFSDTKRPTKLQDIKKELYRISKFFADKGSTIRGAQKIATEQDIAIFGADERGKPLHRMNKEQRTRFWSIYNEYVSTYKNAEYIYGSNRIQQFLGDAIWQNRRNQDFTANADTINQLQTDILMGGNSPRNLFKSHWERSEPNANIYSGKWNPFEE